MKNLGNWLDVAASRPKTAWVKTAGVGEWEGVASSTSETWNTIQEVQFEQQTAEF